jgi:hypothetical protein
MKPIPLNPDTENVARLVIWFEPPAVALADPVRFMAYAMSHATHDDMQVIRRYVSDEDFREARDHAPPGIIDPRSWAYWNSQFGRFPAPPLAQAPARLDAAMNREDKLLVAFHHPWSSKRAPCLPLPYLSRPASPPCPRRRVLR